jgi:hypothetical protein
MKDIVIKLPIDQKRFKVGDEEWLATIERFPIPTAEDIDRLRYRIRFDRQDRDDGQAPPRTLDLFTSDITLGTDDSGRQWEAILTKIQYWLESGAQKGTIEHFG